MPAFTNTAPTRSGTVQAATRPEAPRVLLVCTNLHAQGAETHAVYFAAACRERGVDCQLAAQTDGPIARLAAERGIPVHALRIVAAADVPGLLRLRRIIRHGRFNVVMGSDAREFVPISLAGALTGIRTFLFRHVNYRLKKAEAWALPRLIQAFLPVSRYTESILHRSGVPASKTAVLYNPVTPPPEHQLALWRAQWRTRLGVTDDDVLIGFAGVLREYKGPFLLAEALNQAMAAEPGLRMLWVGPAEQHAELRSRIDPAFAERHHWLGWQCDVRPSYAAIDLLAVPSLIDEAFGRVSIEAQVCGAAVCAHRSGGLPETLDVNHGGRLVDATAEAWSAAITEFARRTPEQRRHMGALAREWAIVQFSPQTVVARFLHLLDRSPIRS